MFSRMSIENLAKKYRKSYKVDYLRQTFIIQETLDCWLLSVVPWAWWVKHEGGEFLRSVYVVGSSRHHMRRCCNWR